LISKAGPVFGVFLTSNTDVGADVVPLANTPPPILERGAVRPHAFTNDGDKAPAGLKSGKRLLNVQGGEFRFLDPLHPPGCG